MKDFPFLKAHNKALYFHIILITHFTRPGLVIENMDKTSKTSKENLILLLLF